MNTEIISADAIVIEEILEKSIDPVKGEKGALPPEVSLQLSRRFGIVDLWKIRNNKRHFSIYR